MAVQHPTQTGLFIIGIECDGASYHSSRTVRERDRLRQSVLEDMGWTIYRIWSTDWIKDQSAEEQKLLNAIEKASRRATCIEEEKSTVKESQEESIEIENITEVPFSDSFVDHKFVEYMRADVSKDIGKKEIKEVIKKIIEIEQPIHFEELCRRVAPLYKRQKVTEVVRNQVNSILLYGLSKQIQWKKDFLSTVSFDQLNVRIPSQKDNYIRPIYYIAEEELALAMKTVIQHSYGITPDNLLVVTAHIFGFKRASENIISRLRRVYDCMYEKQQIKEVDGKVSLAD